MIRRLTIQNYRCLRSVTLNLEPLTVFVGANGSGKSSVFAALLNFPNLQDIWRQDPTCECSIQASRDTGAGQARVAKFQPQQTAIGGELPQTSVLQFDLQQLRASNQLQEQRQLTNNGLGICNLFATLPRREQDKVASEFCRLVPIFADVATRPLNAGTHRFVFQDRWRTELWYEPHQVSDGSMLLLAYLLVAYQSPPPEIIAIEEPERGLHPYLLGQLVQSLRKLTSGEIGPRPVQILLATHSAELLEFVDPREVRFFHRSKQTGETIVEEAPVNDPSWKQTLREYDDSLGDIWLSGGLGGVPGR